MEKYQPFGLLALAKILKGVKMIVNKRGNITAVVDIDRDPLRILTAALKKGEMFVCVESGYTDDFAFSVEKAKIIRDALDTCIEYCEEYNGK